MQPNAVEWQPPSTFDDFEIVDTLGQGGMGRVYRGRDRQLDRPVALKFLHADAPSLVDRRRFDKEAKALAKLVHPNVVQVYRVGTVDDRPYIAYELVEGRGLDSMPTPVPWRSVLALAMDLASGLAAVHRCDLIHRDIKPSNLVMSGDQVLKILDFGLARGSLGADPVVSKTATGTPPSELLTGAGRVVGTPAFMAPELWQGEPANTRTDVYASGLVLRDLLLGDEGRLTKDHAQIAAMLSRGLVPVSARRQDIPGTFAALIDRCVSPIVAERPADGAALLEELDALQVVFDLRTPRGPMRLEDADLDLVEDSFARLGDDLRGFTATLYDRLFSSYPHLRGMFPADMESQQQKLAHALRLAVAGLKQPERLLPMLEDLGRSHAAYGVERSDLALLGDVLLETLARCDQERWSEALHAAWLRAWQFLLTGMSSGYRSGDLTLATMDSVRREEETPSARRSSSPSGLTPPETRYCETEDVHLAWQAFGAGATELVLLPGWLGHVEMSWRHPSLEGFMRGLARESRVVIYDRHGTGLSDRSGAARSEAQHAADLLAVMDAAGVAKAVLFGISQGVATAVQTALLYPDRVRGLVLYAGSARTVNDADFTCGVDPEFIEHVEHLVKTAWGQPLFVDLQAPSMKDDPEFARWLGEYMRMAASPREALSGLARLAALDLRQELPKLNLPTVVIHRRGDRVVPFAGGEDLARRIPGASFVALDGDDHQPFVGDAQAIVDTCRYFIRRQVSVATTAVSLRPGRGAA